MGTLPVGLHKHVPMDRYLSMAAIGSTELGWLATSPLYFRYMMDSRTRPDSDAMALGTAVHMAVLEPDLFEATYCDEPCVDGIDSSRPRATKAYREAVAEMETSGRIVLKGDTAFQVRAMAAAVRGNPHAAKLLDKAPERELTIRWDRDGRACRGRADMLGEGVLADLKTTRSLKNFSPFAITRLGYYRQLAMYRAGLRQLGRTVNHVLIVAVENVEPFDVACYAMDEAALIAGDMECERLFALLDECESSGKWPGAFPDIVKGTITDALAAEMAEADQEVA